MAKPTTDNGRITAIMADVAEVLLRHHASTLEVLTAGRQITVSAYRQIVSDAPGCNRQQLADGIASEIRRAMLAQPTDRTEETCS